MSLGVLEFLAFMGVKIKGSFFLKSAISVESVWGFFCCVFGVVWVFFPPAVLLK